MPTTHWAQIPLHLERVPENMQTNSKHAGRDLGEQTDSFFLKVKSQDHKCNFFSSARSSPREKMLMDGLTQAAHLHTLHAAVSFGLGLKSKYIDCI